MPVDRTPLTSQHSIRSTSYSSMSKTDHSSDPHHGENDHILFYSAQSSNGFIASPSSSLILSSEPEDDRTKKRCKCECERVCSHCWFLGACCWFMISSSLVRFLVAIDIILHVLMAILFFNIEKGFFYQIADELQHFNFRTCYVDLLFMCIIRDCVLYFTYSYKRQAHFKPLVISTIVVFICIIYTGIKLNFSKDNITTTSLISLIFIISHYILFLWLRPTRVVLDTERYEQDIESGSLYTLPGSEYTTNQSYGLSTSDLYASSSPVQSGNPHMVVVGSYATVKPSTRHSTDPRPLVPGSITMSSDPSSPSQSSSASISASILPSINDFGTNNTMERRSTISIGARRHQSTVGRRIGVGGLGLTNPQPLPSSSSSSTSMYNTNPTNSSSELPTLTQSPSSTTTPLTSALSPSPPQSTTSPSTQYGTTTTTTTNNNNNQIIYDTHYTSPKPLAHTSVRFNITPPSSLLHLVSSDSQFILFEGIRIHYKFLINHKYKAYFEQVLPSTSSSSDKQNKNDTNDQSVGNIPSSTNNTTTSSSASSTTTASDASTSTPPLDISTIPPVTILVPGFSSTLYTYDYLLSLLENTSAVLLIDRPGFGLSEMVDKARVNAKEIDTQHVASSRSNISSQCDILSQSLCNGVALSAVPACIQSTTSSNNSHTKDNVSAATTTTTTTDVSSSLSLSDISPQHELYCASTLDLYPWLLIHAPSLNPYKHDFLTRLLYVFIYIYRLGPLGIVLCGHHSGATATIASVIMLNHIVSIINTSTQRIITNNTISTITHTKQQQQQLLQPVSSSSTAMTSSSSSIKRIIIQNPIRGLVLIAPSLLDDGFPPMVRSLLSTQLGKNIVRQLVKSELSDVALKRAYSNPNRLSSYQLGLQRQLSHVPGRDIALFLMAQIEHDIEEKTTYTVPSTSLYYQNIHDSSNTIHNHGSLSSSSSYTHITHQSSSSLNNHNNNSIISEQQNKRYSTYLIHQLCDINIPVLFIHGDNDKIVPLHSSIKLARLFTSASSIQVVTMQQCGHIPFQETPHPFADVLNSFLRTILNDRKRNIK